VSDTLSPLGVPDPITSSGGNGRDDFDRKTKDTLAKRVGFLCSNPQCRRSTSGPHSDPTSTVNIGVAAHITAASLGGPRFDSWLTPTERRQITNGIWLCQSCSKLVDNDVDAFAVGILNQWKADAEQHARNLIEQKLKDGWASVLPDELRPLISLELTTPPPITRNIARSPDGQFWLVEWNSQNATFHWSKVTYEFAVDQLRPVCRYRNLADWRELF
jgi:hypothetical protein